MKNKSVPAFINVEQSIEDFVKNLFKNYRLKKLTFFLWISLFQLPLLLKAQPYEYATFNSPPVACTFPASACSGTGTWTVPSIVSDFTYSVTASTARLDDLTYSLGIDEMPEANPWETKYGNITATTSCLKPRITSNASTAGSPLSTPLTTTITFATATPTLGWGFLLLDIDLDQVDIKAKKTDGTYYTNAQVNTWFKGVFDAFTTGGASSSPGALEPPCWDAANATLVGSEWVASPCARITVLGTKPDRSGAAGYFEPNLPIKSLELVYYSLQPTAFPSQRIFISASTAIPVAVTLVDFNAACGNRKVTLSWKTSEEINSHHFEIEKSADGRSFTEIGTVNTQNRGNSSYNYTDSAGTLSAQKIYYRLKMVDNDGRFEYSKVVAVNNNCDGKAVAVLYPNPTESIATLANLAEGVKKVEVYDEAGRMIKGYNTTNFQQRINLSGYTTGVYTIRLIQGDGIKTFKLIKK